MTLHLGGIQVVVNNCVLAELNAASRTAPWPHSSTRH